MGEHTLSVLEDQALALRVDPELVVVVSMLVRLLREAVYCDLLIVVHHCDISFDHCGTDVSVLG